MSIASPTTALGRPKRISKEPPMARMTKQEVKVALREAKAELKEATKNDKAAAKAYDRAEAKVKVLTEKLEKLS